MRITAPTVAKLLGYSRAYGHRQVRRGVFGPVTVRRNGAYEVELARVEAALGRAFSLTQLASAGVAIPREIANGQADRD